MKIMGVRNFLLDFIFPRKCLNCGQEGEWLCGNCCSLLKSSLKKDCPICKMPSGCFVCDKCRDESYLDGLWVMADYGNPLVEKVIHSIKYNFVQDLALQFDDLVKNYFTGNDLWSRDFSLLPVPLHRRRYLNRGFNQSELICRSLGRVWGNTIAPQILERKIHTKPQAKLSASERQKNIKDAFVYNTKNAADLSKEKIVLVDDVYTTGATMQECAKILKQNGFKGVWGLAVARG